MPENTEVTWEEPPPSGKGRNTWRSERWDSTAELLRTKPGAWAKIGRMSPSVVTSIKGAHSDSWAPPGSFEAVSRNWSKEDAQSDVYVRYVGEDQEHA
jgi:hypothetical protein